MFLLISDLNKGLNELPSDVENIKNKLELSFSNEYSAMIGLKGREEVNDGYGFLSLCLIFRLTKYFWNIVFFICTLLIPRQRKTRT
ncbi:unnamed protein product [Larinioides sclopetarius]|uniref:Uncharacterized protein n=1 Tax=Larinioides sclopetarius TaxID=280406 RepID=A0AAV1YXT4_9ARAC